MEEGLFVCGFVFVLFFELAAHKITQAKQFSHLPVGAGVLPDIGQTPHFSDIY